MSENWMSKNVMYKLTMVAYQSDPFSERVRKRRQNMDGWIQPCHQSLIAFTKFGESLRLGPEKSRNGLGILASVELRSKRMGVEGFFRQPLVLVQSGIEY